MRSLLQYTLDLFGTEPKVPLARVDKAQAAPEFIASIGVAEPQPVASVMAPAQFRHPRANREARLGSAVVAYEFQRSKRRSIGFSVGPDGLAVRAPRWVPLYEVDAALQAKAAWIIRKLGDARQRQAQQLGARIAWCDGAVLPFLGEPVQVRLDPGHTFGGAGAALQPASADAPAQLLVALPRHAQPAQIRDVVQAWLMRQAKQHFTQRLQHFAPQLQVQWRKLSLSNAATRWGSASADGSIRLNWRLIHVKPAVLDYVVVHELSHLRVMDHSPRFWDTVRTVVPDYAQLRGQLKGDAVPRWD